MAQLLVIVGMGGGNGLAIARRFAKEGFVVAMVARSQSNLKAYQTTLQSEGVTAHCFVADAGDRVAIQKAFVAIEQQLSAPEILVYNAAVPRMEKVLATQDDTLVSDFRVNVAGALVATQAVLPGMEARAQQSTILFTGGGFALQPQPDFASLSIGKAGLRSLAFTLDAALRPRGIRVGTITICGIVDETDSKYNPTAIAEEYWKFYASPQSNVEVVY